jgi:hypothetical protein
LLATALGFGGGGVDGARGGCLGIRVNGGSSSGSERDEDERRRRPARAWAS